MTAAPNLAGPSVIAVADSVLTAAIQPIMMQMGERLEPMLPGMKDGAARSLVLVQFKPDGPLGHFKELAHAREGSRWHELFLNSDRRRGHFDGRRLGEDAVTTLAHELAHMYAAEHGIADMSGTIHDAEFGRLARATGCEVVKDSDGSHRTPGLSAQGRLRYADLIPQMERAFLRHAASISSREPQPSSSRSVTTIASIKEGTTMSLTGSDSLVPIGAGGVTGSSLTTRQQRAALAVVDQLQLEGALAALGDDMRHRLTARAIENVAMLSATEAHYLAVAPLAEQRIKAIVDSYAASAAAAIQRLGR